MWARGQREIGVKLKARKYLFTHYHSTESLYLLRRPEQQIAKFFIYIESLPSITTTIGPVCRLHAYSSFNLYKNYLNQIILFTNRKGCFVKVACLSALSNKQKLID